MNSEYFRTDGLSAGYGRHVILSGIEITACRGKITTLIGPNGCGKSTLLRTAAKQLAALSGAVFIDGKSLSEISSNALAPGSWGYSRRRTGKLSRRQWS